MSKRKNTKEQEEPQADTAVAVVEQPKPEPKPIIVRRTVKHTYTAEEREEKHMGLLNALAVKDAETAEFESLKAVHKSKISEAEAQVATLVSQLRAGFEPRAKDCRIEFRTSERKKDVYLVETGVLVATEDMTSDDFQQDLLRAESVFERKAEVTLWDAGMDKGVLVLGRLNGRWFSALRLRVGDKTLDQRLDSEQRSVTTRQAAIELAASECLAWLEERAGKECASGFRAKIMAASDSQKDKEE